jgi:hypothetical protein
VHLLVITLPLSRADLRPLYSPKMPGRFVCGSGSRHRLQICGTFGHSRARTCARMNCSRNYRIIDLCSLATRAKSIISGARCEHDLPKLNRTRGL